jgi:hypothetical protein
MSRVDATRRTRVPGPKQASRRQLLQGLSLAGLASSGSIVGIDSVQASSEKSASADTPEYRETDHVRRFYDLARR